MNKSIKKLLIMSSLLLISSCTTPSTTNTSEIKSGTKVEVKYIVDFYPKLKQGIKYVYLSREKKGLAQVLTRLEYQVTEINENKLKVTSLTDNTDQKVLEIDMNAPPLLPAKDILYEGQELLIVTAGSYISKHFSYMKDNSRFNIWLSEDVGIIKFTELKNSGDSIITELNEFRS